PDALLTPRCRPPLAPSRKSSAACRVPRMGLLVQTQHGHAAPAELVGSGRTGRSHTYDEHVVGFGFRQCRLDLQPLCRSYLIARLSYLCKRIPFLVKCLALRLYLVSRISYLVRRISSCVPCVVASLAHKTLRLD